MIIYCVWTSPGNEVCGWSGRGQASKQKPRLPMLRTHTQPWEESNTWWEFCLSGDFESPSLELCGGIVELSAQKTSCKANMFTSMGQSPGQRTTKGYKGDRDHSLAKMARANMQTGVQQNRSTSWKIIFLHHTTMVWLSIVFGPHLAMKCVAEVAGAKLQSKNQDYQCWGHTHSLGKRATPGGNSVCLETLKVLLWSYVVGL